MAKETNHMATSRTLHTKPVRTKREAKAVAREIFGMMEKKFDQMTPDEERKKHEEIRAILDRGARK